MGDESSDGKLTLSELSITSDGYLEKISAALERASLWVKLR